MVTINGCGNRVLSCLTNFILKHDPSPMSDVCYECMICEAMEPALFPCCTRKLRWISLAEYLVWRLPTENILPEMILWSDGDIIHNYFASSLETEYLSHQVCHMRYIKLYKYVKYISSSTGLLLPLPSALSLQNQPFFYFLPQASFVLRVLSLPVSVGVSVCVRANPGIISAITHHPFKLGWPHLDHRCKSLW